MPAIVNQIFIDMISSLVVRSFGLFRYTHRTKCDATNFGHQKKRLFSTFPAAIKVKPVYLLIYFTGIIKNNRFR